MADTSTASNRAVDSASETVVYFWHETEAEAGYLSQWYLCDFTDETGTIYKTAEHYMMYQKAILFNDSATAGQVLEANDPRKVKSLGRQVKNFDEEAWAEHRTRIVREGNRLKFTRAVDETGLQRSKSDAAPLAGESLRTLLLSTGNANLVEASPFDRVWGVGFRAADAEANRDRWGQNLLGKALMEVREELRKEEDVVGTEGKGI